MADENNSRLVPEQETGKPIDAEESVELNDDGEAKQFFEVVRSRLLQVNKWKDWAGSISAEFQLFTNHGDKLYRQVKEGDYIRIDIPGPGPTSGDGFDWVEVEAIDEVSYGEIHNVSIRVRPTSSPLNEEADIAHFYSRQSTSTFTITLRGNTITAGIYDRNTQPNAESGSITDKVRDTLIGTAAVTGFSKVQWKQLAKGFLTKSE